MLIKKGNIYRNISAERFNEYKLKGYASAEEKPKDKAKEKPKK